MRIGGFPYGESRPFGRHCEAWGGQYSGMWLFPKEWPLMSQGACVGCGYWRGAGYRGSVGCSAFPAVLFAASRLPMSGERSSPHICFLAIVAARLIVAVEVELLARHCLSPGVLAARYINSFSSAGSAAVRLWCRCRGKVKPWPDCAVVACSASNGSVAVAGAVAYCSHRHLRVHPASSRTVASGIGFFVNGCSSAGVFACVVLPGQETVPFTPQSYCRFSVRQCQALRVLHIFLHTLILRGSKNPS